MLCEVRRETEAKKYLFVTVIFRNVKATATAVCYR
jgi:hypothetical protein